MLGIAVIGAGHWGPNLIRNLHNHQTSVVKLVVDANARRVEAMAARYGVDTATDASHAAGRDDVDAVVIATPTATHYGLAKQMLEAGKHVLVEKPMTTSGAEAEELAALASARGLVLMVGHVFVFNPGVLWVKEYLDSGALGRVLHVSAQRTNLGPIRTDVNAAWDLATHDVSILNFWLGSGPVSVSARGGAWINSGVADAVFASLRYPNNVLAHVHASWLEPRKVRLITVVGEKGMLTLDDMSTTEPIRLYDKGVSYHRPANDNIIDTFGAFRTSLRNGDIRIPRIPGGEPLRNECDHFVAAATNGTAPRSGPQEGIDVVKALEAMQISMDGDGREVTL